MKFSQSIISMVQLDLVIYFVMSVLILFLLLNPTHCEVIKKKNTNVEIFIYWKVYEGILHTCVGKVFVSYLLYMYFLKIYMVR